MQVFDGRNGEAVRDVDVDAARLAVHLGRERRVVAVARHRQIP